MEAKEFNQASIDAAGGVLYIENEGDTYVLTENLKGPLIIGGNASNSIINLSSFTIGEVFSPPIKNGNGKN